MTSTPVEQSSPAVSSLSASGGDNDYPVDRKTAPMLLSLTPEQRFALYTKWEPYDVESWYTALARYTFPSVFVPLSVDVARCFLKNSRDLTEEDCALFDGLALEINRAMLSLNGPSSKKKKPEVFVRLNTRSPKDATIRNPERLFKFLVPEFEKLDNFEDRNAVIVALRRGFGEAMRVASGEEAVALLRASDRTKEDIMMAHEFIDRRWPLQVVIREWNDVPLEYELRGFVYDGKLNALSQYNYDGYFPVLHQNINQIQARIVAFWERISKEKIFPFDHAIVDFGIVGDRVVIIECNPFDAYTGPGLFDWEKDWDVLTCGPLQTRVITSVEQVAQPQRVAREGWHYEIEEGIRRVIEKRQKRKTEIITTAVVVGIIGVVAAYLWTNRD